MKREEFNQVSRNDPRRDVRLAAAAFWIDGSSAAVQVSNLSYSGCELQSKHPFKQGETIGLALPGMGKILAQVRWVESDRAGARFLTGDSAADERRARLGV